MGMLWKKRTSERERKMARRIKELAAENETLNDTSLSLVAQIDSTQAEHEALNDTLLNIIEQLDAQATGN